MAYRFAGRAWPDCAAVPGSAQHQYPGLNLLAPNLLIVDDFGLRRLDPQQSSDIYELIIERHRRSSTIFTSNRTVDEWIPLFDDPMLAQSAIDRFRPGYLGHPPMISRGSVER